MSNKTCVVHLNAADFGTIPVDGGYVPVRFSCVAGVKAPAAGLKRVCFWFQSVRVTSVLLVCLVLKRAKLIDAGAIDGLIALEDHLLRSDIRIVCVRVSSDPDVWLV